MRCGRSANGASSTCSASRPAREESEAPRQDAGRVTVDDKIGAFCPHGRFEIAGAATGPLAGLRFAVKDLIDIAGHVTGAGNPRWLETHPPARHTAPCVAALLAAGATMIGKTITDELAYSLNGDNIHYGTPRKQPSTGTRARRLVERFGRRGLRPGCATPRWAPIAAARCGFPPVMAASTASGPAMAACRSTASCRCSRASIRSAGSPDRPTYSPGSAPRCWPRGRRAPRCAGC